MYIATSQLYTAAIKLAAFRDTSFFTRDPFEATNPDRQLYSSDVRLTLWSRIFPQFFTTIFLSAVILHGLKSSGIFNENKRFLGKVIFTPQHSCLRGRYTWYSDFPTIFDALSVVRNVQAFEIRLGFRDDFLIRCESLSLEPPLEVWEQIISLGAKSGEYGG